MQRLSDTLNFQGQALVLRAERHRLLASNVANADTPGYKARDMDFARALREATGAAGPGTAPTLAATHAAHLPNATGARAEPHLLYALPAQDNLDGNTVDMDRERASAADNAVRYEATLRFMNSSVKTLMDAMKAPGQA